MPKFYHYSNCSTCRKAKQWMVQRKHLLDEVDITQNPPTKEQLKAILHASGKKVTDLFNKSGEQYRLLNMKEKIKTLTEDKLLEILSKNGRLIKRPLIWLDSTATIGFKEEEFRKTWK